MARILHRIGSFAYRRAWLVIIVWVVALAGVLGAGFSLGGKLQESFTIPGTESQQAIDKLNDTFPQVAGASARVVVQSPEGTEITDPKYKPTFTELQQEIGKVNGVISLIGPFDQFSGKQISADKRTAFVQVQFDGPTTSVSQKSKTALLDTGEAVRAAGLDIAYGGDIFQDNTVGLTIVEAFGVLFAAVVLLVTFGSLIAAGMPLLTAVIGVGVAFGGIWIVSSFTTVSSTSPMLAVMIGLAVGIDYALFILSRHRTQLARGMRPLDSVALAVGTAGGAVVFAGLTVIIALLGLLVVGIPFLSVMGVSAAATVFIAVCGAITLLPAILRLAGDKLTPKPNSRAYRRANAHLDGHRSMGRRWVDTVLKTPIAFVIGVAAILGVMAIPAASIDLNMPTAASEPAKSTQRIAYDMMSKSFGEGANGPLLVMADIKKSANIQADLANISQKINDLPDVAYVSIPIPNSAGDAAIFQVIPKSSPSDQRTKTLVNKIRELEPELNETNTPIAVTGYTAVSIDISNKLNDALIPFTLVVVGLSVILLLLVFRSLFVPIKAALGFLLSAFGAIGLTVMVFQWGWLADILHVQPGPILSFLPILLIALLFGLAMDYEMFLVSGMREEYVHSGDARSAVVHGFEHAARVVTAAALIMFFVFFAFVPEGKGVLKAIAFALSFGVALDAFLIRMTLVPAAMALAGRAAWWLPKWLDRLLPNLDIEGAGLLELEKQRQAAAAQLAKAKKDAAKELVS